MNKYTIELEELKGKVRSYGDDKSEANLLESYITYAFALGEARGIEKAIEISQPK